MCPCLELDRDLEEHALGSSGKFFDGRKLLTISRDLDPLSSEVLVAEGSLEYSPEGCLASLDCWEEARFIPLLFGCRLDSLD